MKKEILDHKKKMELESFIKYLDDSIHYFIFRRDNRRIYNSLLQGIISKDEFLHISRKIIREKLERI